MADQAAMFEELLDIMSKDMAVTVGCTGPISFIYTSAVARELSGGSNVKHIRCVANGKFCARMGEVVTPGLPEDNLEIACAIGAVAGDSSKLYEVIKDKTPEQVALAQKLSKTSVEIIPIWDAKDLVYVDVTVETENGTGRCVVSGTMRNIILKERNGEILYESDYVPGQKKSCDQPPISKYTIHDLYTFCKKVPIEKLAFLKEAMEANEIIGQYGMEHKLGAGIGYTCAQLADDPISRVKALSSAACEARMVGVEKKVISISGKGNLGIATILPTLALAKELGRSEEEAMRAIAMACLLSIRISVRIGGSAPIFCSCLLAACQAAAAGYVMLHNGGAEDIERAIQNTMPATFGAICDGARNACAMRMISAIGTGYDAARLAMAGVQIPPNEGVIGLTSEDTVDILSYMSDYLDMTNTALMRKMMEKRPLTPKKEKLPV